MLKDFNVILKDMKGNDLTEPDEAPITLKAVAVNSLLAALPNDSPSGEEKVKRFLLATKIQSGESGVEVTPEDIVLIKRMVGQAMATLIVGQVFVLLDA